MSVRPIDIAERLGLARQTINGFIRQGMPTSSIEDAEAWYHSRGARRGADASETEVVDDENTDKNFADIVERHRQLKARAYDQYLRDLRNEDTNQSKSYATYDKLVKTLVSLERELHARNIAAKEYIKTQTAIERFGKVVLSIRNELTQFSMKVATKANPDSPGTAMKAIDAEITKMLLRLSTQVEEAEESVVETPIIITDEQPKESDQPDEVIQDGDEV
jgi:molybdopterin converting factor small subunit